MQPLKPGDAAAFQKLFNSLIKYQTMRVGSKHNPLDTPEMMYMILSKLPLHLQDRWNRNTLLLRRRDSREATLIDLANFVDNEVTLVNDSLYSREAVSQYLEKGQQGKVIEEIGENFIQWPPRQTIHQKVHKREIKQAVKGPTQCAVKSMIYEDL